MVHLDHGIGVYRGLKFLRVAGVESFSTWNMKPAIVFIYRWIASTWCRSTSAAMGHSLPWIV